MDAGAGSSNGDGPYVLRELIRDVPLSADGEGEDVYITCADAWEGNLYIGTSAGEILHFVSIPPDASDTTGQPTYILASRTQPAYSTVQTLPGVQHILLLPRVSKACILCNGTLTFYTLPELSPAFGGKIKQGDCTWVGGLDRNQDEETSETSDGVVIVICLKQKLRVIRIGDQARKIRDIELGGVVDLQRRDDLACVADSKSYSLLDVVNQRKIDLFPISSAGQPEDDAPNPADEWSSTTATRPVSRSFSARSPARGDGRRDLRGPRGHERISSLGSSPRNIDRLRPDSPSPWPARNSSRGSPSPTPDQRAQSPSVGSADNKPLPEPPAQETAPRTQQTKILEPLKPHIASPSPNEFLLTTGTTLTDPGVGMFVNLDGDVVRGTIEFSHYPESLVIDNQKADPNLPSNSSEEGFVLAVVSRNTGGTKTKALEFQRWDVASDENMRSKGWLDLPPRQSDDGGVLSHRSVGLRHAVAEGNFTITEISNALSLRRLPLSTLSSKQEQQDAKRNQEEDQIVSRFGTISARILLFAVDRIWWAMRNPLVIQLDSRLNGAITVGKAENEPTMIRREQVEHVINDIRGQEARNEFDFFTLNYIRQKASLLLLMDLIIRTAADTVAFEHDKRATQDALISSDIDPRIVLLLIPVFSDEVVEGPQGIWIPGGVKQLVDAFNQNFDKGSVRREIRGAFGDNLLQVIKQYLFHWRRKKGFGSVMDEEQVFQTVDAALLHLLLLQDSNSPRGPATAGSVRAELNDVVDRGVECFDRGVALLEQHKRLYVLSRLYQSRKMVSQVLATWRRILEGEPDEGGEMIDGEQDVRRYLTRLRDAALVKEYGTWLANRNPKLGVQVFADDNSRTKFTPAEAAELLKAKAPAAVKHYLEHLVFGKNHVNYVNDLIAFYLDTVLDELETSQDARSTLIQSYETYRALKPPKPTYHQFIMDNAVDGEWWHNRLRLLQLIGGSHDAASQYDVDKLADRLAPYSEELVPEMIILNGRRGNHVEALRLLTHGLGDFDTAIRYCLLGGSSIFHPRSGSLSEASLPSREEQEKLFGHLLDEFMKIEDEGERLDRTAELLARFGAWFDLAHVLTLIPDSWPVEQVSNFIVHALRRLVKERNETIIVKALSSAQNLQRSADLVEKTEGFGPTIIRTDNAAAV